MGKLLRLAVAWFACAFCITCGFVFAQSQVNVTGTASNEYVGDVTCNFVVENGDISGTCSNDYFGDIVVGDNVSLEANGDIYNVEGYGEFASPFTVTDATYNYVYFDQGDRVRVIGTEITGTMTNAIVGNMVFGAVAIPVCGNGSAEWGEACDDGNTSDNDGCSATCDLEAETEEFTVVNSYPLNLALDVAVNQPLIFIFSDDVNRDSFEDGVNFGTIAGVSFDWLTDSIVRVTHDNFANNTLYTVTVPTTVQSEVGGRALNAERSFSFRTIVSGVTPSPITCGDAYTATDEECDDGNRRNGDGCDATCDLEEGWSCGGMPSICYQTVPACGDGHVDKFTSEYYGYSYWQGASSEGCDDGNVNDGDGCDESCEVESGFLCGGTNPSICLVLAGQTVETPEIVFPTVFTWYDTEASTRVSSEQYRVYLPGYEVVGADWVKYDAETGEFYVDALPSGLSVGEYLFTVREIATGNIRNAKILIADVAKFFSEEGEPLTIQWLTAIISAADGEDPAGLGVEGKTGQVAMFLSLMREIQNQ